MYTALTSTLYTGIARKMYTELTSTMYTGIASKMHTALTSTMYTGIASKMYTALTSTMYTTLQNIYTKMIGFHVTQHRYIILLTLFSNSKKSINTRRSMIYIYIYIMNEHITIHNHLNYA